MITEHPCALGSRLLRHATEMPETAAFSFYHRHDDLSETINWGDLWLRASKIHAAMPDCGRDGTIGVLIFCEDELNFILGLVATWMAGAVAIPAAGGMTANLQRRNEHIIRCSQPDLILHDLPQQASVALQDMIPEAKMVALMDIYQDGSPSPDAPVPVARLLQFTSGSTLDPKPVLLDSQTIAAGCTALQKAFGLSSSSVGVSWLPLYHDMGLIGHVLQPLWTGGQSVLLRSSIFIQQPVKWLATMSLHGATITSGPNFAYDRLSDAVKNMDLGEYDLSTLETVIVGGEHVAQPTVQNLLSALGPCGLSADAIAPSYGMAEVTLLASSGQRKGGPEFDSRHSTMPVANLGEIIPELVLTLRDPDTQRPCRDGTIGEIFFDGPGIGWVISKDEDWRIARPKKPISTGDFGYIVDGQIHIVGRSSNKIILRGRNVFAEDVEALTRASQLAGFSSGLAAVGLLKQGTESLCILIEQARRNVPLDLDALNKNLLSTLGIKPSQVVLLRRFTLPRTSSGKIRRAVARDEFLSGAYEKKVVPHV